jgi:hypothetical protein
MDVHEATNVAGSQTPSLGVVPSCHDSLPLVIDRVKIGCAAAFEQAVAMQQPIKHVDEGTFARG